MNGFPTTAAPAHRVPAGAADRRADALLHPQEAPATTVVATALGPKLPVYQGD